MKHNLPKSLLYSPFLLSLNYILPITLLVSITTLSLWSLRPTKVLGTHSDDDIGVILAKIKIEQQANLYPSRQLYLNLAIKSWQLFDRNSTQKYLNQATALDPNDPSIEQVKQILK